MLNVTQSFSRCLEFMTSMLWKLSVKDHTAREPLRAPSWGFQPCHVLYSAQSTRFTSLYLCNMQQLCMNSDFSTVEAKSSIRPDMLRVPPNHLHLCRLQ